MAGQKVQTRVALRAANLAAQRVAWRALQRAESLGYLWVDLTAAEMAVLLADMMVGSTAVARAAAKAVLLAVMMVERKVVLWAHKKAVRWVAVWVEHLGQRLVVVMADLRAALMAAGTAHQKAAESVVQKETTWADLMALTKAGYLAASSVKMMADSKAAPWVA